MNKPEKQIAMPVLGEQATDFYQAELNRLYGLNHDHQPCPLLRVETVFERINACLPDNYAALAPLLNSLFEKLAESNAAVYLFPNITLHAAIDRLQLPDGERTRLVSPLQCAIAELSNSGIGTITLVGTRHTMQSDQLAGYFVKKGIEVCFPEADDIRDLDGLRLQVFAEGYSASLKADMERLLAGYDKVVLACTELSMLNKDMTFIDLARLQMAAAIAQLEFTV